MQCRFHRKDGFYLFITVTNVAKFHKISLMFRLLLELGVIFSAQSEELCKQHGKIQVSPTHPQVGEPWTHPRLSKNTKPEFSSEFNSLGLSELLS